MTTGTIRTFDPARGTGTICCISGTPVPFATRGDFSAGDRVAFRLSGGIAGLYATHVELAAARESAHRPHHATLPRRVFRSAAGSPGVLAG